MSITREPPIPPTREIPSTREQLTTQPFPAQFPPAQFPASAPILAPTSVTPRHTARHCSAPNRLGYDGQQGRGYIVEPSAWLFLECGLLPSPLALKAKSSDPDTLSYDNAMTDTPQNVLKWMKAARKKIKILKKN
jgi:hypothetical protein